MTEARMSVGRTCGGLFCTNWQRVNICLLLKLRFLAVSMAWSCARRAMVEGAPGLRLSACH